MKRALALLLLVVASFATVWSLPELVHWWSQEERMESGDVARVDTTAVDSFLAQALERIGADEVLARDENEGVVRAIHRLPRGADAVAAAQRVRDLGEDQGIELYVNSPDGLDAELRIYAGRHLRARVLLIPDLGATPSAPRVPTLRERPLVSLVVAGLGGQDVAEIMNSSVPLSLAVRPWTPFALRIAREGLQHWHEILVHMPATDTDAAARAVPWASGWLLDTGPEPDLPSLDMGVLVYPAAQPGRRPPSGLLPVPAQRPARLSARETLARTRALAVRNGAATMIIEADDPELSAVLAWAQAAHLSGFRMALASEVARADQVRGLRPSG